MNGRTGLDLKLLSSDSGNDRIDLLPVGRDDRGLWHGYEAWLYSNGNGRQNIGSFAAEVTDRGYLVDVFIRFSSDTGEIWTKEIGRITFSLLAEEFKRLGCRSLTISIDLTSYLRLVQAAKQSQFRYAGSHDRHVPIWIGRRNLLRSKRWRKRAKKSRRVRSASVGMSIAPASS